MSYLNETISIRYLVRKQSNFVWESLRKRNCCFSYFAYMYSRKVSLCLIRVESSQKEVQLCRTVALIPEELLLYQKFLYRNFEKNIVN